MKSMTILTVLLFAGGWMGASPASAHRRDFPFTYEWLQPLHREKEIETHTFYSDRDHQFIQQIEFEYGVTGRLAVAPYLVFERKAGESLKYHEFKLESRYQLGSYASQKVLPSLYLEYARESGGDDEVEGKLILSRYDKEGRNLSLNLIFERALESGSKWEKAYSIGYAQPLEANPTRTAWRGGFEMIHHLTDKRVNAGPVVGFRVGPMIFVTGVAFPLNRRDGNRTQFRLLTEYEWF